MLKKIILIQLIICSSLMLYGQDEDAPATAKSWNVKLGYRHFRLLDKNVSPLVYVSNNGAFSVQFQKAKPNKIWQIGLSASAGSNQSKRFGHREAVIYDHFAIDGSRDSAVYDINPGLSFVQAGLFYSVHWKIKSQPRLMYLGGIVQDDFYFSAVGADVWLWNQLSISPSFRLGVLHTKRSSIDVEFSTPVFSYIVKQPYTLDHSLPESNAFKATLKTGSSLRTVNKFQQVNLKIRYQYLLQSGKQVGIGYHFMWMNDAGFSNRNLKAYSNSLFISYTF